MRSEFDRCESNREAFGWAIGCVIAGFKERVHAMLVGNLKISKWVLAPEMLLCFVPLTFAWRDAIVGDSGILRLNIDIIQTYFIGRPGGEIELAAMIAGAVVSVLGPIGLIVAFRLIVLGRPIRRRWLRRALVIGPVLWGLLTMSAHFALGGLAAFSFRSLDAFDFWSGILFLSALPALGAAHMLGVSPTGPIGRTAS
jgi:hypothetical protein